MASSRKLAQTEEQPQSAKKVCSPTELIESELAKIIPATKSKHFADEDDYFDSVSDLTPTDDDLEVPAGRRPEGRYAADRMASNAISVMIPVLICMSFVALNVELIPFFSNANAKVISQGYPSIAPSSTDSAGDTTVKSLIVASAFIGFVIAGTCLIVLLYVYKWYKFLFGYFYFGVGSVLFLITGVYFHTILTSGDFAVDFITVVFLGFNFGVTGIYSIFGNAPLRVRQGYVVFISSLVAINMLVIFPKPYVWTVLFILALWDLVAVLTPCGPLKILVETAQNRGDMGTFNSLIYSTTMIVDTALFRHENETRPANTNNSNAPPDSPHPSDTESQDHSESDGISVGISPEQPHDADSPGTVSVTGDAGGSGNISKDVNQGSNVEQMEKDTNDQSNPVVMEDRDKTDKDTTAEKPRDSEPEKDASTLPSAAQQNDPADGAAVTSSTALENSRVMVSDNRVSPIHGLATSSTQEKVAGSDGVETTRTGEEGYKLDKKLQLDGPPDTTHNAQVDVLDNKLSTCGGDAGFLKVEDVPLNAAASPSVSQQKMTLDEALRLDPADPENQSAVPVKRKKTHKHKDTNNRDGDEDERDDGVKLGLGDFIFYSLMIGASAGNSIAVTIAVGLSVIVGLVATLLLLTVLKKALPALPISIFVGIISFLMSNYVMAEFLKNTSGRQIFM